MLRGEIHFYRKDGDLEAHDEEHDLKSSNVNIFDFDAHQVFIGRCSDCNDGSYFGDNEVTRRTARVFTAVASSNVAYMSISQENLERVIELFPVPWEDIGSRIDVRKYAVLSVIASSNKSFFPRKQSTRRSCEKRRFTSANGDSEK